MKTYQTIIVEGHNKIITILLNRPDLHNAIDDIMIAELTHIFLDVSDREDVRLVVLRGKGKSFCAGADLNYMKNIAKYGEDENLKDSIKLAKLFSSIYECSVPTIALVHGACFGGANGLIAACDIVLGGLQTVFAFSEVKMGLAPATIAPFVIKRIGEFGARELMITGKRFKGAEASKWNLLNHAFEEDDLEIELGRISSEILAGGPKAIRKTKELITKTVQELNNQNDGLNYHTKMIAELRISPEGQEGMAAFLEKRKPDWSK